MTSAVCVTGVAWSTALGDGVDDVWSRLLAGDTGLRPVPSGLRLRNPLAAARPVPPPGATAYERHVALAAATARAALADAGVTGADAQPVLATSLGPHLDEDTTSLYTWAEETGRRLGSPAPPVAVSTACSSGSDAIALAATLLRAGAAARCVAGGIDLLTDGKRLGHTALGTMTPTLPRSFDKAADGMLPGDGAAFLVLEPLTTARDRGARVHGVLTGWAASNDAAGLAQPDPTGTAAAAAVRQCLAAAGVAPDRVAAVSTHGTATEHNDAAESACLRLVFGDLPAPPVGFATKGALGHTLGATGAIEAITVLLALRDRRVPPVAHAGSVTGDLPLPLPVGAAAPLRDGPGLSLTLGFGGFNTALLLDAPPAS
ncbi:beta-ketoacyl synthase N-terminal-like domain-containing protein [Dactylosporangium sp. AC04546]|uniref:beta-ketoacyl synthase N-terminal-like domain-containing protein n=1 Tax=Dactylosporangium sp. AC04546 TaxID=2862460 RepID=UPI001EDD16C1|nr:beta-ketoacyl synthase N-terminal-like domain-containing protein [Dactylosporangium sp. AC04546]WVK88768.1 beta-ketoacyl synthase N-terminal-like domain-containing protein [Dactylosporangium sp. AC04546]